MNGSEPSEIEQSASLVGNVEQEQPSSGCMVALLVMFVILFLSLSYAGSHKIARWHHDSECPPFMDSGCEAVDSASGAE